jgi:uncharacterized protein YqhQ
VAVALRAPGGEIVWAAEPLGSVLHRSRLARAPLVRGLVVLYETLVIGTRWLMRSGAVAAAGEGVELGRGAIALTLIFAVGLAVGLFVLLPLLLAQATTSVALGPGNALVQHIVEGLVRVVVFIAYLLVVARAPDVRRVFRYHGAEHMTIHALEHDVPLTVPEIRRFPTAHPRCGTEFLVVLVILSIIAFSALAGQSLLVGIIARIVLIPVLAAIAYELLRFGARYRSNRLVRWIFLPGIWLQEITTAQPEDGMIEVAIAAMREALRADGEAAPPGSEDPYRRPLGDLVETPEPGSPVVGP